MYHGQLFRPGWVSSARCRRTSIIFSNQYPRKLSPENIASSRLLAPGFPRMSNQWHGIHFGITETKLGTLKYDSKSIQKSLIFETASSNIVQTLKIFVIPVILFKIGKHSDFHLSFFSVNMNMTRFYSCRKLVVLGDAVSKLERRLEAFVWILNQISRFITWSLFALKASYLVK